MVARLPIIHPYHHALNAEVANEVVGTTTGTRSNQVSLADHPTIIVSKLGHAIN